MKKQILSVILMSILCLYLVSCNETNIPKDLTKETSIPTPTKKMTPPTPLPEKSTLTLVNTNAPKSAKIISTKENPDGTYRQELAYEELIHIVYQSRSNVDEAVDTLNVAKKDFPNGKDFKMKKVDPIDSYPAYEVDFTTGLQDDIKSVRLVCIATDTVYFTFSCEYPTDFSKEYDDLVETWIAGLKVVDSKK